MSTIEIDTTQNVSIRFQTANVLQRILAKVIDITAITTFFYACLLPIGLLSSTGVDVLAAPWMLVTLFIVVLVVALFYPFIMESIFHGQTLGKMALNIRVVRTDGTEPSVGNYAIRFLIGVFEVMMTMGVVATFASIVSKSGQRLGDMAAGTLVVLKPRKVTLEQIGLLADRPERTIKYYSAGVLTAADIEILREVLHEAKRRARTQDTIHTLLEATKDRIEFVTGEKSNDDAVVFLGDVLADYNTIHGTTSGERHPERGPTTSDTARRG